MRRLRRLATAVAVVVPLTAALLPGTPASAGAFPGTNGKIVYIQNGDIYSVNPDGSGNQEVVATPGLGAGRVSVSADGRWVAFDRHNASYPESTGIYVVNIKGSQVVNLLAGYPNVFLSAYSPTWSPDGKQVAFVGETNKSSSFELYRVDSNGTHLTAVTNCDCMWQAGPAWAPSGQGIAYVAQDGSIHEVNAATGADQQISDGSGTFGPGQAGSVDWSPDGSQIAYDTTSDIYRVAVPNGTPVELAGYPPNAGPIGGVDGYFSQPAWSPDGSSIAVQSDAESTGGDQNIFSMDATNGVADGTITQVTHSMGSPADADWAPACTSNCAATAFPTPVNAPTKKKPVTIKTPKLGVYDCIAYNGGNTNYFESLKLAAHHRYQQAFSRHHARLVKPTKGSYAIKGKIMSFKGGALRRIKAEITPENNQPPALALLLHGKWGGITCYHVQKP